MSPKLPDKETESSTPELKKDIPSEQNAKKPITFQRDLEQKKLKEDSEALSREVLDISENLKPKPKN